MRSQGGPGEWIRGPSGPAGAPGAPPFGRKLHTEDDFSGSGDEGVSTANTCVHRLMLPLFTKSMVYGVIHEIHVDYSTQQNKEKYLYNVYTYICKRFVFRGRFLRQNYIALQFMPK